RHNELVDVGSRPLHLHEHPVRVVAHPPREPQPRGQPMHERPKPHPLHNTLDPHVPPHPSTHPSIVHPSHQSPWAARLVRTARPRFTIRAVYPRPSDAVRLQPVPVEQQTGRRSRGLALPCLGVDSVTNSLDAIDETGEGKTHRPIEGSHGT